MNSTIRVRFAPSPTGFMHLGNVRTALINYLFAQHYQGTFIVRIEDTDQQRMFDEKAQGILRDLSWLGLSFQEGPLQGGPYSPYYQSERNGFYHEYLQHCIDQEKVYRCFCTAEELEKKRERQIAQKIAPRYDRTCLKLNSTTIEKNLSAHVPYIWRFKLSQETVTITDLARGPISYNLEHFSDFAITRQDGSCTFIFANFVDDVLMKISHVIRGEDHLSNTASQAALYQGLSIPMPIFWHLPIITNTEGKKLSKRDFGFSLHDLRAAGYLPEAIINYLSLLGSSLKAGSPTGEILSLAETVSAFDFEHITSTGQIKYDIEKLRWINQKWIQRISLSDFKQRIAPLLDHAHDVHYDAVFMALKPELVTLNDIVEKIAFYHTAPLLQLDELTSHEKECIPVIKKILTAGNGIPDPEAYVKEVVNQAKQSGLPAQAAYATMRLALTGKAQGLGIKDLIVLLGKEESYKRFSALWSA